MFVDAGLVTAEHAALATGTAPAAAPAAPAGSAQQPQQVISCEQAFRSFAGTYKLAGKLDHCELFSKGAARDQHCGITVYLHHVLLGPLFTDGLPGQQQVLQLGSLQQPLTSGASAGSSSSSGSSATDALVHVLRAVKELAAACVGGRPKQLMLILAQQSAQKCLQQCLGHWQDFGALFSELRPGVEYLVYTAVLDEVLPRVNAASLERRLKVGGWVGGGERGAVPGRTRAGVTEL